MRVGGLRGSSEGPLLTGASFRLEQGPSPALGDGSRAARTAWDGQEPLRERASVFPLGVQVVGSPPQRLRERQCLLTRGLLGEGRAGGATEPGDQTERGLVGTRGCWEAAWGPQFRRPPSALPPVSCLPCPPLCPCSPNFPFHVPVSTAPTFPHDCGQTLGEGQGAETADAACTTLSSPEL